MNGSAVVVPTHSIIVIVKRMFVERFDFTSCTNYKFSKKKDFLIASPFKMQIF